MELVAQTLNLNPLFNTKRRVSLELIDLRITSAYQNQIPNLDL